jgi:type 1 fimbria pilin
MNFKALPLALAVAALAPFAAQADTVTFTGEIMSSTCEAGGTGDYTAPFDQLDSNAFTGVHSEAGMTHVDIAFTGCPTDRKVGVHFTGNADLASGYLNNGAAGTATGVGVKIYNGSSQHVHLGQALPASSYVTPAGDGSVTLRHHAALVQTADTIVDGSINAVATIVVQHQ